MVVTSGEEAPLQVFGYNLPGKGEVALPASEGAEVPLPEPFARFRMRRAWKVGLSPMHSMLETEPNDSVPQAETLAVPGAVNGQLTGVTNGADVDCFVFEARRGTRWVIETVASMRGSESATPPPIPDHPKQQAANRARGCATGPGTRRLSESHQAHATA